MTVCLPFSDSYPQTVHPGLTMAHIPYIFTLSVGDFACLEWPPSCDVPYGENASIRSALFELLTVSSMLMNLRNILNDVSLRKQKHT